MLACPRYPYKYYLFKVGVFTYLDVTCLPELAFLRVRSSKIYEISFVGLNSSKIRVSIEIRAKNSKIEVKQNEKDSRTTHTHPRA